MNDRENREFIELQFFLELGVCSWNVWAMGSLGKVQSSGLRTLILPLVIH